MKTTILKCNYFLKKLVDMRWGITDAMQAEDVCMEEIKRCNEMSFGPTFIVNKLNVMLVIGLLNYRFLLKACLSNRYGTKCLQSKIPFSEYKQIYKAFIRLEDKQLFKEFYELDENFISNQIYLLKNKKEVFYKVKKRNTDNKD